MTLDSDLQALQTKIDGQSGAGQRFSAAERQLITQALGQTQQSRDDSNGAHPSRRRREIDFFGLCLGYGVLAFAVLALLRWSSTAPLDGPGVFGLAFLTGLSGAVLRAYYPLQAIAPGGKRSLIVGAAGVVLIGSLIGLMATGAIGGVLGLALGVLFFHTLVRYRRGHRGQTEATA